MYNFLRFIKLSMKYFLYGFAVQLMFITLVFASEVNAQYESVRNVRVSINVHDRSVSKLFNQIESKTDFTFSFNKEDIRNLANFSLNMENVTVAEVLEIISKQAGLRFRQRNNNISVGIIPPSKRATLKKQLVIVEDITVKGKVTDENGGPLPSATVTLKGTQMGTFTDIDGNYRLTVPEDATLIFSFIGYQNAEIAVNSRTTINVQLFADLKTLQEVVVVGYGTTERKDLTGSVASIESKSLQQVYSQTIDQSLVGKLPGVFVTAVSGKPGAGATVYVRGLSALRGDNQPLYVVDGVPVIINPQFGGIGFGVSATRENPLLAIDPNDVERVDVLKDASAAAIYGSRGARGVVLITTKRGKSNTAPKLNFSITSSIQKPIDKYDYLNAAQWREYVTQQSELVNPAILPFFEPQNTIINDPDNFFGNEDTDWQDEVINKNALWMQYNVGLSGGSDKVSYSASANISDQEGILIGNNFDRYGFRGNLDGLVTKNLKIGTSISYNYAVNEASGIGTLGQANFRPDLGIRNTDGSFTSTPFFGGFLGPNVVGRNPVGGLAKQTEKTISQNLLGNVYGEYNILEGLSFRSDISISVSNDKTSDFSPSFSDEALFNLFFGQPADATLAKSYNASISTVFTNRFNYNAVIAEKHRIDASVGAEWNSFKIDLESTTYAGFPDDEELINTAAANRVTEFGGQSFEQGLNSLFGRVNYVFDDRYLATFTARRDGSTKFGPDNQYGFFPSGALAWNAHNEGFLRGNKLISQLKLRGSFGRTGSDNLPTFTYLSYIGSLQNGDSRYVNDNGLAPLGIPNESIRWEETDQLDIGLELGLFKNRLNAEVVYFTKNTSGIILFTPIPNETGFASFDSNIADVSNKGWEITLGGDIIRKQDIRWNSSFNISFIKNNVENLFGGTQTGFGNSGVREGYPIGSHFGYEVVSIAQTQEEIDALNANAPDGNYYSSLRGPGDYIFSDANGDGEISRDDFVYLGDINPDYYGGWNNTVTYKDLEFTFNFQYAQGLERNWSQLGSFLSVRDLYLNTTSIIYDTWTPENTGATYARIGSQTIGSESRSVGDASYIRLRTIGLAYNLPQALLGDRLRSVRIFVNANNILTITDYPGLDPESVNRTRNGSTTDTARDEGNYPIGKSFSFGLNIGF